MTPDILVSFGFFVPTKLIFKKTFVSMFSKAAQPVQPIVPLSFPGMSVDVKS